MRESMIEEAHPMFRILKFSALVFLLLMGFASLAHLPAQVAELCGNGIDDDGDTLVDCDCDKWFTGKPRMSVAPDSNSSEC